MCQKGRFLQSRSHIMVQSNYSVVAISIYGLPLSIVSKCELSLAIYLQGKNISRKSCIRKNILCTLKFLSMKYVTGPAKMKQVGTKYTISQNDKYLAFYVQYLLSANCKMFPIKFCIDGKNVTSIRSYSRVLFKMRLVEKCDQILCAYLVHFCWLSHIFSV